jgi:dTDP-4-amino-4,6-dideoxygalactose transaminase
MKIPFVDLYAQYLSIKKEVDDAINEVIKHSSFIRGPFVSKFEEEFAKEYNVKHCIGVANGTDALYITLKMLEIGSGDEVITVANSWISSSETISQTGAKPVFIDNDDFYLIDVSKIEEKITTQTKAIMAVHLYGQMADVNTLKKICEKYNLHLIEDCAQAHFAELDGIRAGKTGIAATFSFFPTKNLGAYGDAGAIITNDNDLAIAVRKFSNHGMLKKHIHEFEGINSRLDGLQASILSAKLPYIHEWTYKRIINATYYIKVLSGISQIKLPIIKVGAKHVFHLFVIKVKNRTELISFLDARGIATAIHYPTPLPFLPAYDYLQCTEEQFPNATSNQKEILSLPLFPELPQEQIDYIGYAIRSFYTNK